MFERQQRRAAAVGAVAADAEPAVVHDDFQAVALHAGKLDEARKSLEPLVTDASAPQGVRAHDQPREVRARLVVHPRGAHDPRAVGVLLQRGPFAEQLRLANPAEDQRFARPHGDLPEIDDQAAGLQAADHQIVIPDRRTTCRHEQVHPMHGIGDRRDGLGRVLGDQDEFLNSLIRKPFGLFQHRSNFSAPVGPPDLWNGADLYLSSLKVNVEKL